MSRNFDHACILFIFFYAVLLSFLLQQYAHVFHSKFNRAFWWQCTFFVCCPSLKLLRRVLLCCPSIFIICSSHFSFAHHRYCREKRRENNFVSIITIHFTQPLFLKKNKPFECFKCIVTCSNNFLHAAYLLFITVVLS